MVHPAPRMMNAPEKKRRDVPNRVEGDVIGSVRGAARRVLKRQGRKR